MKNIKSLNKEDVNFKNKKQRLKLYHRTFMKYNIESRLFTLQKEAINLTAQTLAVALEPSTANLLNLSEAIGDVETTIEFVKLSIPNLAESSANIKYSKLETLKTRTDENEKEFVPSEVKPEHEKETETSAKAAEAIKDFSKSVKTKKSFFGFIKHCRNY